MFLSLLLQHYTVFYALNKQRTNGGHRVLLLHRNIMVVYQQHLIHRTEYKKKDNAQKDSTIFSDLNKSKYDLTNPIKWIVLFIAKDSGKFSCLPGLSEN